MFRSLLIVALWLCSFGAFGSTQLPIPSDEYAAFLLEPWKPNAPILTVFTDPFCPYCIKALKRRDDFKNYNTYLLWYPIFGERSDKRVEEIFHCPSPSASHVIEAVIAGKAPGCDGPINAELIRLNRLMYEAYSPDGVPSYYTGGVKVSIAELKAWRRQEKSVTPNVVLDWSRYDANRLNVTSANMSKVVVVLPHDYSDTEKLIDSLKANRKFEWYLFQDQNTKNYEKFCKHLVGKCDSEMLNGYEARAQELALLFGLDNISKMSIVLNGKVLSDAEVDYYFSFIKRLR